METFGKGIRTPVVARPNMDGSQQHQRIKAALKLDFSTYARPDLERMMRRAWYVYQMDRDALRMMWDTMVLMERIKAYL